MTLMTLTDETKDNLKRGLVEQGKSPELAEEMISMYENWGGLGCYHEWPEEFTLFSRKQNAASVFLEFT
jgi:hypothetical protein